MYKKVIIPLIIGISVGFIAGGCQNTATKTEATPESKVFKKGEKQLFFNGDMVEVTDTKTNKRYMIVMNDKGGVAIQELGAIE